MRQWSPLVALVLSGCAILERKEPPYHVITKPDEYVILAESQFTPQAKEVDAILAQLTPAQRKRLNAVYILGDDAYWNAGRTSGTAAEVPSPHEIYMRGQEVLVHPFGEEGITIHEIGHVIHLSRIEELEKEEDPFISGKYTTLSQEIEKELTALGKGSKRSPLENLVSYIDFVRLNIEVSMLPLEEIPPSKRFEREWGSVNPAQTPKVMLGEWLWEDSRGDEPRAGYASPYATKNLYEDVAEAFRIYCTKDPSWYECDPIVIQKIELLRKYGFFE